MAKLGPARLPAAFKMTSAIRWLESEEGVASFVAETHNDGALAWWRTEGDEYWGPTYHFCQDDYEHIEREKLSRFCKHVEDDDSWELPPIWVMLATVPPFIVDGTVLEERRPGS